MIVIIILSFAKNNDNNQRSNYYFKYYYRDCFYPVNFMTRSFEESIFIFGSCGDPLTRQ